MSDVPLLVVGIGASAGGLSVLKELVSSLDKEANIAYIVVQHLDPNHESLLSELLDKVSVIPVTEAKNDMTIEAGHIYIIPPDRYLEVADGQLKLIPPQHTRGLRRAVDHLFRSLASNYGLHTAGVVLSGAGNDGAAGLRVIQSAGGLTVAQDPDTAQHNSMPLSAIETGIIDKVLPVKEISDILVQFANHPYRNGALKAERDEFFSDNSEKSGEEEVINDDSKPRTLQELAALLETYESFDLRQYKPGTVLRRIARRMSLIGVQGYADYLERLRNDVNERKQLTRDLLINVTDFFRDSKAFELLEETAIANIIQNVQKNEDIRLWVAGCASGEEAYSLAILLSDGLKKARKQNHVKIFATDIDDAAIKIARRGVYPHSIIGEIPKHYLEQYFTRLDKDHYQIKQHVRDLVSFASQNVANDPPFSRMHLITCRNLLIYLKKEVQEHVLNSFYFALNDNGYLFLGSSETLGNRQEMFKSISKKWRLYQKIGNETDRRQLLHQLKVHAKPSSINQGYNEQKARKSGNASRGELIRRALLSTFQPPTVVLGSNDNILYNHGDLTPFMVVPSGEPRNDFSQTVRPDWRSRIRSTLFKVRKEQEPISYTAIIKGDDNQTSYYITVAPIEDKNFFEENAIGISFRKILDTKPEAAVQSTSNEQNETMQHLDQELLEAREELQNTIEELETSTEELKAAHEETLSTNEELQSANEELEASSEELRSLNEELSTVNSQLKEKIEALQQSNNDVENFISSTKVATIFLDTSLSIQRYTQEAERLLKMGPRDLDRKISSLGRDLVDDNLMEEAQTVLHDFKTIRKEVKSGYGKRWYIRQINPYRTEDRRIDGVVITFHDITEIKELSHRAEKREQQQAVVAKLGLQALTDIKPEDLMHQAVRQIAHVLDVEYCKVLHYQPQENNFLMVAGVGWQDGLVGKATVTDDLDSQAGFTYNAQEPIIVDDLRKEKRFHAPALLEDHYIKSGISCIINHTDPAYGVLGVHSTEAHRFSEDDANFVMAVANLLSTVLRNDLNQRNLLESEQSFRLAKNAAELGIYDFDPLNNTIQWDDRVREIWGLDADTPVNYEIFLEGLHPDDHSQVNELVEKALDPNGDGHLSLQYRVINKKDQKTRWISAMGQTYFENNQPVRVVGTVIDISQLKQALEDAEHANKLKSEFLAMMSHEIRTPMNAVVGIANILDYSSDLSDEKRKEMYAALKSSSTSLMALISDILDISKIESESFSLYPQPFQLDDVIQDIARVITPRLNNKVQLNLELDKVTNRQFIGDVNRIRQIILNLAGNAAKFTIDGSITINTKCPAIGGVEIEIQDTGVGIPEDKKTLIFDKFIQSDASNTRRFEGTGLGLSIVKSLVELMQGTVKVDSVMSKGSTFRLWLPLPSSKTTLQQSNANKILDNNSPDLLDPKAGSGKSILLVEDHEPNVLIAHMMLEDLGYEVTVIRNGCEAVNAVCKEQHGYAAILLDIRMPGMDGYEVMQKVRSHEKQKKLKPTPIIALTANALMGDRQRCLESGATDYLAKPFEPNMLKEKLRACTVAEVNPKN